MRTATFLLVAACAVEPPASPAAREVTVAPPCSGPEVPYDGVDNDCDPSTPDDDLDGDGLAKQVDCDDRDPEISDPVVFNADADCDNDGVKRMDDCDDADPKVGAQTDAGIAGSWRGDLYPWEMDGFCDGYCRRPVLGSVIIEDTDSWVDFSVLSCVPAIEGDLIVGAEEESSGDRGALVGPETLRGLERLGYVGGSIEVVENDALRSLEGLGGLRWVGGDFQVYGNPVLERVDGPTALHHVGGNLALWDNPTLASLDGLGALEEVGGRVTLDVPSVLGLSSLTRIGGTLDIGGRAQSLAGLESLQRVGGLDLIGADALTSLTGLEQLAVVDGDVAIGWCDGLTSLEGLDGLRRVRGDLEIGVLRTPNVYGNLALESLRGLEGLESVDGSLSIVHNHVTDIEALHGLALVGGDLQIANNHWLTDAQAWELVDAIELVAGTVTVADNGGLLEPR